MPIMAQRTQQQQDQGGSLLMLNALIEILQCTSSYDEEHQLRLLGRFFNSTEVAGSRKHPLHKNFKKKFVDVLGKKEAEAFLTEFNRSVQQLKKDLNCEDKKKHELRFENGGKPRVIRSLEKLKE